MAARGPDATPPTSQGGQRHDGVAAAAGPARPRPVRPGGHHVYVALGDQLPDAVRDKLARHTWAVDEITAPRTDRFVVLNATQAARRHRPVKGETRMPIHTPHPGNDLPTHTPATL